MSTVTPNTQPRNRQPRDWGNYSGPEHLPNGLLFTGPASIISPLEAGDTATVLGRGTWDCVSAGTPGVGDAVWTCQAGKSQGFQTGNAADYYQDPAAGTAPGADDFVVLAACATFENRDPGGVQIVAQNVSGLSGWRIAWSFGSLIFEAFDSTGASVITGPGLVDYYPDAAKGHLHALALRARQVGGVLSVEGWLGPCRIAAPVTGAAGMNPAVAGQLSLGANAIFSAAFNGAVFGLGYYEGTVSDDDLREALGDTIMQGTVPLKTSIPFSLLYDGWALTQGAPSGAVWTPTVGPSTLARQGAPAGSRAYFPAL